MATTGNRHPPLPDNEHFRILTLEPGLPGERVYCSLQVARIPLDHSQDASVVYDALSYAFGREHPTFEIILGVWPIFIRENLYKCLQRIRHPTNRRSLWVDTISINMKDTKERATQVGVMDKIYRGARRVLVWLGPNENGSEVAMNMIAKIATDLPTGMEWSSTDNNALLLWANRPYWSRTWIVQEFLLARDIVLMCGSDELGWPVLESFVCRVEREHRKRSDDNSSEWSTFVQTPAFRLLYQRVFHGEQQKHLKDLLVQNRDTACFEPRDKIYAMLGLAADVHASHKILVSYSIDKRALLYAVVRHIAPEAKDVLRWVRFLVGILNIERQQIQRAVLYDPQHDMSRQPALDIYGFAAARIVKCGALDENLMLRDSFLQNSSRPEEWNNTCSLLSHLKIKCVKRLETCLEALRTASPSNMEDRFDLASAIKRPQMAAPFLTVAFTSGCIDKRVLFGIGHGQIRAGDHVIQFLGNEIALAVEANSCSTSISGCVMFPIPQSDSSVQDRHDGLTSQRCFSHILQSEADCVEGVRQFHFQTKPLELLALAQ